MKTFITYVLITTRFCLYAWLF